MQTARWPSPLVALRRAAAAPPASRLASRPHFNFNSAFSPRLQRHACSTATRTTTRQASGFLHSYRLAVGVALPAGALTLGALGGGTAPHKSALECASADRSYATPASGDEPSDLTEAESILNIRDLGFGTVSGICVGVFIKKGLRAIAFAFGGVFVLLQYLSSRNFVTVDWGAISRSYDSGLTSRFGPTSARGGNRLQGLWAWFLDFVGANIQSRATFVLGVTLGMRLG
ncbi:hypothetical protein JCM8202v2_004989 [Rhodotorula sphaerocarpa]